MTDDNRKCAECGLTFTAHNNNDCMGDWSTPASIPGDDGTRIYRDSTTDTVRELTADDLTQLRSHHGASYARTGVQVIDDLLCVIEWATSYYHDATRWGDEIDYAGYGPLREGENFSDLIQSLANDGADEIRKGLLR